jgi:hypothetical protein
MARAVFDVSPGLFDQEKIDKLVRVDQQPIAVTKQMLDEAYLAKSKPTTSTFKGFLKSIFAVPDYDQMKNIVSPEQKEAQITGIRTAVNAMGGYWKAKEYFEKNGQPFPAHPILLTEEGRYLRELQKKYGTDTGASVFLMQRQRSGRRLRGSRSPSPSRQWAVVRQNALSRPWLPRSRYRRDHTHAPVPGHGAGNRCICGRPAYRRPPWHPDRGRGHRCPLQSTQP